MDALEKFLDSILEQVPNFIYAIVLLIIAFIAAKIVKSLVTKLLKAVKAEAFLSKLGVKDTATNSSIEFVAKLAYFVTFLLFLPGVLDKIGMHSVSSPITNMVDSFLGFIPKLVATLLQSLLESVGADSLIEKITGNASNKVSLSKLISSVVQYVLVIMFLVQGINVLKLPVLTGVGSSIIGYMPAVLSVVLIVAIGVFAANTAETAIAKKFPEAKAGALATKVAIYVLVGFLSLSQLGVATAMVETTFILIIAAICVAFAIAFGVGGRTFAANTLDKVEKKIENKETEN